MRTALKDKSIYESENNEEDEEKIKVIDIDY
jgi:hypothetical protein